jgi:hypothetical protein
MKKSLFILVLLIGVLSVLSAVPRELVVVEIATGTWCGYCPGAAMGAHDLLQNGHAVAIVKNHNGDNYANDYSNARNTYYGVTGYPTAYFDGLNPAVGGSATQSTYNTYLPRVNARLAVPSHYALSAFGMHSGNDYTIMVNVAKPEADTNTNVVLHTSVTQSNIPHNWGNQTEVDNVNRIMSPDQNGTPINLATGESTMITLNFTIQAGWPLEDLELVLWLQNATSKEILQGKKYALDSLLPATNVSTDLLMFPDTSVNTTTSMPLTLANLSTGVATGTLTINNPAFVPAVSTFTLQPYSAQTIDVQFSPNAAGVYNGVLTVNSNFPDPTIEVVLTGTAFTNTAPIATNVTLSGVPVVYQFLEGSYVYSDPDTHIEGTTLRNWVRIVNGTPTEITGATDPIYQITEADLGNTIAYKVTPVDFYGLAGTPVTSAPTQVIIPLPTPQNFTAALTPPNTVTCTWEKPQYFDGRGFAGYRLYRNGLNIQTIPNPNTLTFTDTNLNNGTYEYYICAVFSDPTNMSDPSPTVVIIVGVANDDLVATPEQSIKVNPNPFSNIAHFEISGKANLSTRLEIFNLRGQLVNTLAVSTDESGKAITTWNGLDAKGKQAKSGVYIYRMNNSNHTLTGKLMLVK